MLVAANDDGHVRPAAVRLLWSPESPFGGARALQRNQSVSLMQCQGEPDENTRLIRPDPENEVPT